MTDTSEYKPKEEKKFKDVDGVDLIYFFFGPDKTTKAAKKKAVYAFFPKSQNGESLNALFDEKGLSRITLNMNAGRPTESSARDALKKFWVDWFAKFPSLEVYVKVEDMVLSRTDRISTQASRVGKGNRSDTALISSASEQKTVDTHTMYTEWWDANMIWFTYYRKLFHTCSQTFGFHTFSLGQACPFMLNKPLKDFPVVVLDQGGSAFGYHLLKPRKAPPKPKRTAPRKAPRKAPAKSKRKQATRS